jgi:hypothetical protein
MDDNSSSETMPYSPREQPVETMYKQAQALLDAGTGAKPDEDMRPAQTATELPQMAFAPSMVRPGGGQPTSYVADDSDEEFLAACKTYNAQQRVQPPTGAQRVFQC